MKSFEVASLCEASLDSPICGGLPEPGPLGLTEHRPEPVSVLGAM